MAEILIISTCTVRSATDANLKESTRRIELTPWELLLLKIDTIQKGLLFHTPKPDNLIHHLKTSLSRTLDFFPPLAGRLATTKNTNNTTSFHIDCNNAGVTFTHAIIANNNLTVADILDPLYVPNIVRSFFSLNGTANHEGVSNPLLAVQVTELADGFFIGCSINHSVVDGSSFWHFVNSWSEISRGFTSISKPPALKRWFPDDVKVPIGIPLWEEQLTVADTRIPPPLKERVFHFSGENIAKLKAKANQEMGTDRISSLQALLAHIWRSVIRCRRNIHSEQEFKFNFLIGARQRLRPPLPEEYFGSAAQVGVVKTTVGELLEHGLGWAAWEMHKMVASQTDEEVRRFCESWAKNPNVIDKGGFTRNSLSISSSPRFNVYGNDFGWGKPVAVRSGVANKFDGKMTIFPGVQDKSVDIEACLCPDTLSAMCDDKEFMQVIA